MHFNRLHRQRRGRLIVGPEEIVFTSRLVPLVAFLAFATQKVCMKRDSKLSTCIHSRLLGYS